MSENYHVSLVNQSGCQFDTRDFVEEKNAIEWASGRNGGYFAYITDYTTHWTDVYKNNNNKLEYQHTENWGGENEGTI